MPKVEGSGPFRNPRKPWVFGSSCPGQQAPGEAVARVSQGLAWKLLPPDELAAHLLATLTVTDSAWTTEPRLPRENRESLVRRIVLGETPASTTAEAVSDY